MTKDIDIEERERAAQELQWTAEELAIMKRGGSVPVIVGGVIVEARMPLEEAVTDAAIKINEAWTDAQR